jgi:hypothetical protein
MNSDNNNNDPNIIVRAVPVHTDHVIINVNQNNLTDDMEQTYALGKTIKFLSCFDILISLFYTFYNYYYLIPLLFGLFGYIGAKKYNSTYILIYNAYSIINLISRVFFMFYLILDDNINLSITSFFLLSFIIVIELWIIKIVFRFYSLLKKINVDQLNVLRENNLRIVRTIYW